MGQESTAATGAPAGVSNEALGASSGPGRHSCSESGHPAEKVEMRRKLAIGGGEVFVRFCTECSSQIGGSVPLSRVADPRIVPRLDVRAAHRPQPNSKRRAYQKYLKSAQWKRLRSRVLERDGYACQARLPSGEKCGEVATEAAHRNYDRPLGEERLEDLEANCGLCNRDERERRITRHVLGG